MDAIDAKELDVDGLYNLLVHFKIPEIVARRFREQMIDGDILVKMNNIPVLLIPEIGIQIKFCEIYENLTGRTIDYPPGYQFPKYQSIETQASTSAAAAALTPQLQRIPQQFTVPVDNNDEEEQQKIRVPYPAPLPEFSDTVEHKLQTNECLQVVYLMNRELVDFYQANNYDLSATDANRNITQTILDTYPQLLEQVQIIVDTENHIRNRRVRLGAWTYLSKKLSTRKRYVKRKNEMNLRRAALLLANDNLDTLTRVTHIAANNMSTPIIQQQVIRRDYLQQQQYQQLADDLVVEREEEVFVDENNNRIEVDENNNEVIIRGTQEDNEFEEEQQVVDDDVDENNNNSTTENANLHTHAIVLSVTQENLLQELENEIVANEQLQKQELEEEREAFELEQQVIADEQQEEKYYEGKQQHQDETTNNEEQYETAQEPCDDRKPIVVASDETTSVTISAVTESQQVALDVSTSFINSFEEEHRFD